MSAARPARRPNFDLGYWNGTFTDLGGPPLDSNGMPTIHYMYAYGNDAGQVGIESNKGIYTLSGGTLTPIPDITNLGGAWFGYHMSSTGWLEGPPTASRLPIT